MSWLTSKEINLIVSEKSWYLPYAQTLAVDLQEEGFSVNIRHRHTEVDPGSIAFYLSYSRIVTPEYIRIPYRSLVIHASALPRGKGFSPWVWQVLEGKKLIPVTLFSMTAELDAGDIYDQQHLTLIGNEFLDEIRAKLAQTKRSLILDYVNRSEEPSAIKQNGAETFYRKRTIADSEIDPQKSIAEQFDLFRVVDNNEYPAFFNYKGRKYILRIGVEDNV